MALSLTLKIPTHTDVVRVSKSLGTKVHDKATRTAEEKFTNLVLKTVRKNPGTTVWVLDEQTNSVSKHMGSPVATMVNHGKNAIAEARKSIRIGDLVITRAENGDLSRLETEAPKPAPVPAVVEDDDQVAEPVAV